VIFAPPAGDDPTTSSIKQAPFLYLALFINPFLTAGGTIALRKVKKIHEYVISFWLNLTTLILNLVFVYALGQNLGLVLANMDGVCWFYSVLTGIFVILQQVCRFIALQNEKAAKL
jgi:hypothetical protein